MSNFVQISPSSNLRFVYFTGLLLGVRAISAELGESPEDLVSFNSASIELSTCSRPDEESTHVKLGKTKRRQERENMSSIRSSKGNLMTRVMGLIAAAGISKNVTVDNSKFRWPAIRAYGNQVEAELDCAGRSMRKLST